MAFRAIDRRKSRQRVVERNNVSRRVAVTLVPHVAPGDAALRVHHRDVPLERSFIPLTPGNKEVRDFSR